MSYDFLKDEKSPRILVEAVKQSCKAYWSKRDSWI